MLSRDSLQIFRRENNRFPTGLDADMAKEGEEARLLIRYCREDEV